MQGGKREPNHMADFAVQIGERVRQAREQAGLTQAQLAQNTNTHVNTIGKIESGKVSPRVPTLLSIAIALEKPFLFFLPLPPEYRASVDELPYWIRECVIYMNYINDEKTQRQITAMIEAAAENEIDETVKAPEREMLKELNEQAERGEKFTPQMKEMWKELKERYE